MTGNHPETWRAWHWFWAKVFGRRMPTSAERVHIGNLVIRMEPGTKPGKATSFGQDWSTDARKVYVIGDLWVFDYGDTPFTVIENPVEAPSDLGDHADLLRENMREYPSPA